MADTLTTFNPEAAGFRLAGPITRKPRTPSSKPQPKPQYADAVLYSYEHKHPLEAEVPVRSVEDTVRKLKAAARYLERHDTKGREFRVQVSVEPVLGEDKQPVKPARSTVKFLGHAPWVLGRRVAKVEAEAREAGAEAGEQAAEDAVAARQPKHRRTVAGHRPASHRRPKASLHGTLVGSVITATEPPLSHRQGRGGFGVFRAVRVIAMTP
jgi:hypothetical protein